MYFTFRICYVSDDCKNIGNILAELIRKGYVGKPSWRPEDR